MTTREQIAVLRAIAEGDLDRHTKLRDDLQAAGRLDDYEAVLAAAFQLTVRKRFPVRCSHKDVVDLVAEARMKLDPTGVSIDPSYVELIVRSVLDDPVDLGELPTDAYPRAYKLVCNYLATERKLGDLDTFVTEAGEILDDGTTQPRVPGRRREVGVEDAAALAGMLAGLVVGVGLAAALGAVTARRHRRPAR